MRFSREQIHRFGEWSGDRNPLHLNPEFARETHFGRPIAHGVLTVLEGVAAALPDERSGGVTSLDLEFRSAVEPGDEYDATVAGNGTSRVVSLHAAGAVALTARVELGTPGEARAASDGWWASVPEGTIRVTPAARSIEEFDRGVAVTGRYAHVDSASIVSRSCLSTTQVRVLALCSYITGMELPGLRSLFTRITVQLYAASLERSELIYRARTVRFDRQFRLLDTQLEIVTPDGVGIATAHLRSYVPFSPATLDVAELAARIKPSEALNDRVALVIGAGRGLGAEIAASLALAGCEVYASARHAEDGSAWAGALTDRGARIELLQGDAGDLSWCQSTLQRIRDRSGRLDLVVLNACAPPTAQRFGVQSAARHAQYVRDNLQLVEAPLATFADALDESGGCVVCVSSSFVEEQPSGFGHYVAVKQAAESLTATVCRERGGVRGVIVRPPVLLTRWNDTPAGVVGAISADRVAVQLVGALERATKDARPTVLSEFPALTPSAAPKQARYAEFSLRLAGSFTTDALAPALRFWMNELEMDDTVRIAPYGQVLQSLLDPASVLNGKGRGINAVCLRVRDWLRELADDQAGDIEFVRSYLHETMQDFERAVRTHRAQAAVDTLLVLCPSHGALSSAENIIVRQIEADLSASLTGLAGLEIVAPTEFHQHYAVNEDEVYDPLRDEIAHIPYRDEYLHVLAAIVARNVHRRVSPLRKVVVVDCDNTLWRGVVGEVGAEGVTFDEGHRALHRTLERLTSAGVLVCLCSKNEESDVWRVFETRSDLLLQRDRIVAAMINWLPKSQNIRTLAGRLNLGLDSFVFIDDNPVECAEVRTGCPEVLTLEWPDDEERALRLLRHLWEFDPKTATKEDARRTDMYREEFRRQELRAETLTFEDFIDSLQLVVDFSPLVQDDLRRAAQLTLRTNQFNFTTIRREEADVQALVAAGRHEIRTVRVRDRFGDYGLVGLLIAERGDEAWTLDTFLLSCRVLGRGVEHRIMAELGGMAMASGARAVRLRVDTTKRNRPARAFIESIIPAELARADERVFACDIAADLLAAIRFEPASSGEVVVAEDGGGGGTAGQSFDAGWLRRREQQIARVAFDLATGASIRAAAEGRPLAPVRQLSDAQHDIAAVVHGAFADALRLPVEKVAEVDRLEALGCDSLKIVEITVALSEKFPWLPGTLLFEHRSVRAIVEEINTLSQGRAGADASARGAEARPGAAPDRSTTTDIAVVGMHLRCAGANSPQELWELLSRGGSAVRPVPIDREHFLHPLVDSRSHWAGLLDDPARFDAELFGVSPREAEFMDPQLRLFLEVAWNALEDAGCLGDEHEPDTGVFAGVMYGDYGFRANLGPAPNPYRCWEGFSLANRLSQLFGFGGPSLAVDTACSSSATAVHLACAALAAGDCRVAVVGGVNLILDPDRFASLGRLGILSERGRCEPFGADADGTVLGEGAGVVVLRPLADALRRGDRIHGVIKATGVSTGNGTVGFTAPNPQAQAEAIRRALSRAAIDPRTVTYIETHGTGTHLGDPIEVRGLSLGYGTTDLFDATLPLQQRSTIGSIKPNIGHLEAGAGVMGLIKVLLQLQRGMLLPSVTSSQPNPQISFARGSFDVQTSLEPWARRTVAVNGTSIAIPRRAGLSSFGVGGANVHIIVEEPPDSSPGTVSIERPAHVLALSATTETALTRQAAALRAFVGEDPAQAIDNLCFTVNTGRKTLPQRAALIATSRDELLQSLQDLEQSGLVKRGARGVASSSHTTPKIAFLFTGQGSQYAGMGRELYQTQPVFRNALDRCAALFDRLLDRPLLDLLFADEASHDAELLNQTGYTQPALFAFQVALSELWASWGIRPDIVMGHSVGEIAALCVAGGVSLEDGLKQIAARGRLMQALPAGGTMTSVMADEARVIAAIAGAEELVAIAAINAPQQVVISGDGTAVAEIAARLSADGIKTKNLTVSHAFHSPLMKPMLAEYERVVRQIRFTAPRVPFVSCVEGELVHDDVTRPDYWLRQVMDPVRFAAGMNTLSGQQVTAFVEIGPSPVLLGMGRQCLGEETSATWLPSMRRESDTWQVLLGSLSSLYVQGAPVDWGGFDAPYARRRRSAPGYAFNRKPYWLKRLPRIADTPAAATAEIERPHRRPDVYEIVWRKRERPADGSPAAYRWVIVSDHGGVADALAHELTATGAAVEVVSRAEQLAAAITGATTNLRVAYLRGIGSSPSATVDSTMSEVASTLADVTGVVRVLTEHGHAAHSLWIATCGAMTLGGDQPAIDPLQSMLAGFARTVSLEHPDVWGGLVDVDGAWSVAALARELSSTEVEDQVALRGLDRYVARLVPRTTPSAPPLTLDGDGTYLVTGGLGALGLHAAEWLARRGARRLVLVSRRGTPNDEAQARIRKLAEDHVQVTIAAADVSRAEDVDRVLAQIAASGAPLRGVVHAAGSDVVTPLLQLTEMEISEVIRGKVAGAQLLHDRTRASALDLFLCFSSLAAILGSHGRAHYGAANAYLDGLVEERRRLGLRGTSLNWGPWRGGGIATADHLEQFERVGNHGLDPAEAIDALDALVAGDVARASVMNIDWTTFTPVYESRRRRPLLAEVGDESRETAAPASAAPWIARLRAVPVEQRATTLSALVQAEVAETLGFDEASSVPPDRNFYQLGMDSLMMADFVGRLRKQTGVSCSAVAFNHPEAGALAAALLPQLPLEGVDSALERDQAGRSAGEALSIEQPRSSHQAHADVIAFQSVAYPKRRRDWLEPRWRWMFLESAARLDVEPRFWAHRDDGRIVGQMGSIAVRLKVGDAEYATGWLVDTIVLPEYRSQAVGSRLMVEAHEDQPFSLSLGQTAEMREIQLRLGWKQVAPLQAAQLLVRPENVLKSKLPAPAAWAAGLGWRATSAVREWLSSPVAFTTRPVDRFDARHDALWRSTSRDLHCAVVRDAPYLNWKYVEQPGQHFARFDVMHGNDLRGVAVWMLREPDSVYKYRRAFLVDLVAPFADPAALAHVVSSACAAAVELNADALLCQHIGGHLTTALRACGFHLRTPERFLLVDPGPLSGDALQRVLSSDAWYVTQGDSDIDRPW
jgi:FkbH-like protein